MEIKKVENEIKRIRALQIEVDTLTDELLYDLIEGCELNLRDTKIDCCDSLEEAITSYIMTGKCNLNDIIKEINEQL